MPHLSYRPPTYIPLPPVSILQIAQGYHDTIRTYIAEFLMKCQVVHVSSGVCILKNKTVINMKKNTTSSAPLGLLQFQTDMFNLCLEVSVCAETDVVVAEGDTLGPSKKRI